LDFFEKWHPYFQQQQQQQQQQAPPRAVAVPPTTTGAATGAATATTTTAATPPPPAATTTRAAASASASANATASTTTFPNIAAAAIATPQLSSLVEVASAIGLAETLADENLVATAFAPNNAAFAAFLKEYNLTPDQLTAQPDLARLVLSYHLVPGVAATASSLTNGQQLPTQDQGQTITVIKNGNNVSLKPSADGAPIANVVTGDIKAGKAIVHIVDQVLVPANFPLSKGGSTTAAAATNASSNATATGGTTTTGTTTGSGTTGGTTTTAGGTGSGAVDGLLGAGDDNAASNNGGAATIAAGGK
jgi:uncharacterized surface protein with fasciclin (FAS1) repeats